MKFAYTAFVLTLLALGASAYLFYEAYQQKDQTRTQAAKIEELQGRIGAMENGAGREIRETKMESAHAQASRDALTQENQALLQQVEALKREQAVLNRSVASVAGVAGTLSPAPGGLPALAPPPSVPAGAATGVNADAPDALGNPGLAAAGAATNLSATPVNSARAIPDPGQRPSRPAVSAPALPPGPQLTPEQKRIVNSASIGQVDEYHPSLAFVVINAGSERRVEEGTTFAIRRDSYIVGQVRISTVEATQSIGNVVGKLPPGMMIEKGDDVIMVPVGL